MGKDGDEGAMERRHGVAWHGAWRTVSIMPAASGDERHDDVCDACATYSCAMRRAQPRKMWVFSWQYSAQMNEEG